MLPFEGADAHSSGAPSTALTGAEVGERQQKPKTLPCKYCSKRFRRVEHVQRHERTHTKEKPFSCGWDRCGKTFGRRDLLVRHEKLVHLNEGSKDGNRPRKLSSGTGGHRPSDSDGKIEQDAIGLRQIPPQPRPVSQHQQSPQQYQQQHPNLVHPQQSPYHHEPMTPVVGSTMGHDPRMPGRANACNLDLLSDAALASEVNSMPPMMNDMQSHMQQQQQQQQQQQPQQVQGQPGQHQQQPFQHQTPQQQPPPESHNRVRSFESMGDFSERSREEQQSMRPNLQQHPTPSSFDDYNMFLDDYSSGPHLLPPQFEPDQQLNMWSRQQGPNIPRGAMVSKPSSQFPSPFGSIGAEHRDNDDQMRSSQFRVTVADHSTMKTKLEEFSAVLPADFVFPSRHTLTRFFEGYIHGFHEHLPLLHIPTLSPVEMSSELLLAILAVGAQYRFEIKRSNALWYAAKSVAMEQTRRRRSSEVDALLPTASSYSPHSTRPSPSMTYRHSFASAQSERPTTQDTHKEPYSPNTPQARLETIQAVLLLFAVGLWGARTILNDALSLQSQLAIQIRQEGLNMATSQASITDWEQWIKLEGAIRTKLIAFCFFNLCSTAYNMPPLLLTSELNLYLPTRSRLWRAETAWQWHELRQSTATADITVHDAFSRLFGRSNQGLPSQLSSLGNYVLIHALIQHTYLLKQTSFVAGPPYDAHHRALKPDDVDEVTQALRVWHTSFEHRTQLRAAESGQLGGGDSTAGGPLAHNATALLRLAHIRLYTDISPSRSLEARDPMLIASTISATPLLLRSLRLHRAVFHAIHALSMLVKVGVNFVARTKTTEWSIQHSLCNFECAILLSKWLQTLAAITPNDPPASPDEKSLLDMVRRMLDETEFAVPVDPSLGEQSAGPGQMDVSTNDGTKLRQLASAVLSLWAETFKGNHIFNLVKVMGSSLDGYADLLGKPRERTPIGRAPPEEGMS